MVTLNRETFPLHISESLEMESCQIEVGFFAYKFTNSISMGSGETEILLHYVLDSSIMYLTGRMI